MILCSPLSDAVGGLAEDPPCLFVLLAKNSHHHGIGDFSSARKSLSSQSTFGPKRWAAGDGSFAGQPGRVPDITYRPLKFFNKIRQERSFLSAQHR
jgi:hypothetical protein